MKPRCRAAIPTAAKWSRQQAQRLLRHRTVDSRFAIINDTHVTPATVHDAIVYRERPDRQRARSDFNTGAVGLDAEYAPSGIAKGLEDRGVMGLKGIVNPPLPRRG